MIHFSKVAAILTSLLLLPMIQGDQPSAKIPVQDKRTTRTDLHGDPLPAGAIARLGSSRFRQDTTARCVAFSPDGKMLASAGGMLETFDLGIRWDGASIEHKPGPPIGDNPIRLSDAATGKTIRLLRGHFATVLSVSFSADGKMLASASADKTVRLWDMATGKEIHKLQAAEKSSPLAVVISPDGKLLASAWDDKVVRLSIVASGKEIRQFLGHQAKVQALAFSADGKTMASASDDKTVRLWDSSSGKELRSFPGNVGGAHSIAFSTDGKTLASAGVDQAARLWDVASGKEIRKFQGQQSRSVAFSPDGKTLASAGDDKTVRLWETASGKEIRQLHGYQSHQIAEWNFAPPPRSLAFSPDGKTLASAGGDGRVRLWNVAGGKEVRPVQGHVGNVRSLAYSPDSTMLATVDRSATVRLWEASSGKTIRVLEGFQGTIADGHQGAVAFSPDGKMLASAGTGGIRLNETSSGKEIRTLQGPAHSLAFSPDGKTLAAGGGTQLGLWDTASGKEIRRLEKQRHKNESFYDPSDWGTCCVIYSPDGKFVYAAGDDRAVRMWDAASGKEVRLFWGVENVVQSLAISKDGKTLAASSGFSLWVWDTDTGKQIYTSMINGGYGRLAFHPDGKHLISADGLLMLLDARTGKEISKVPDQQRIYAMAISPDGKTLASGGSNGTVHVWRVSEVFPAAEIPKLAPKAVRQPPVNPKQVHMDLNGVPLPIGAAARLEATARINSLAFSQDGKMLAAAHDGRVRLWDAATGKEIRVISGHKWDVRAVAFSPDGVLLATGGDDATVRLWDRNTGKELCKLSDAPKNPDGWRFLHRAVSLAFSLDGKMLASVGDKSLVLWDVAKREEIRAIEVSQRGTQSVVFSPDGKTLAAGSMELSAGVGASGRVRLWEKATGKEVRPFPEYGGDIWNVAFSSDGEMLASTNEKDTVVRLWEAATGKAIRQLGASKGKIWDVAFSPDAKTVAYTCEDNTVRLWEVATGKEISKLHAEQGWGTRVVFAPDGKTFVTGGTDTTVLIWRLAEVYLAGAVPKNKIDAKERESLWAALADEDPAKAYQAAGTLILAGSDIVPFLQERLRPAALSDKRVAQLLDKLDSDSFAEREKASDELQKLGRAVRPALIKALAKPPAVEAKLRIEALLEKLLQSTERLRIQRAVTVLEQIGSAATRQLLETLSKGAEEGDLLVEEARKARRRMKP